jgi:hypothetical protein
LENHLAANMTAITFDTHKFIRKLKIAGFDEAQAEAVADAFSDAQGESDLTTKRDIGDLRRDIDVRFERFDGDLRLLRWMAGMSIALSTGTIALLTKLLFLLPH